MPTAYKILSACYSIPPSLSFKLTCKQSSEVLTMRGDFDWQASSKGRKYLSASMKFAFGGATVPSLGQRRRVVYFSKRIITANYPSSFFTFKAKWYTDAYKDNAGFSYAYFL